MRLSFWVIMFTALTEILAADNSRIYLGCKDGIYRTSLNLTTSELSPALKLADVSNPSFLTFSKSGDRLYAVTDGKSGTVAAWKVATDGTLEKINEQPSGGAGPCHLSLSPSGKVFLVANYSGGSIASFRIENDGSIGKQASFFQLEGSGPNPKRQTQPHAHGIYCDPSGKFVYLPDLGTDKVWIYRLNSATGELVPNKPAFAALPPGSGPRHLTFGTDGRHVYVNGEMGLDVIAFALNPETGALENGKTIPVFPPSLTLPPNADTAEIAVHPNARFLYISTRGYNSVSSFSITPAGDLIFLENFPLAVNHPRHFSISPDGKWMVVPGQKSDQVTVLTIDPTTGKLGTTDHTIAAPSPMCAIFAP